MNQAMQQTLGAGKSQKNSSSPRIPEGCSYADMFIFYFLKKFIYLAAPCLSFDMQDLVPGPGMQPRLPALGV